MEVMEIFTSFQCEGVFTGMPAVFLRLGGCNLNCEWCDTEYKKGKEISIEEIKDKILEEILKNDVNLLVITGGEPFLQKDEIEKLLLVLPKTLTIQFETNGTKDILISDEISNNVFYVISPKINKKSIFEKYEKHDNAFFKFVISNENDIDEISKIIKNYEKCVWLQPEYNNDKNNARLILKSLDKMKNIRLSIQGHKYLNLR